MPRCASGSEGFDPQDFKRAMHALTVVGPYCNGAFARTIATQVARDASPDYADRISLSEAFSLLAIDFAQAAEAVR